MKKQILLYGYIYNGMAVDLIESLNEADQDSLMVRVNSGGGDVEAGYGIISNLRDYPGKLKFKVDGAAHSMALLALAYFDDVEAIDVSQFLMHRAAYPSWVEDREDFKGSVAEQRLIEMNKELKKALKSKINVEAFEELKGVKFNDVFSMEDRIDVVLSAREAKKIGLINKVVKLNKASALEVRNLSAVASSNSKFIDVPHIELPSSEDEETIESKNTLKTENKMTIQEFKTQNPEAYNSMKQDISAEAIKQEKDRAMAWLTFVDVDAEAVKKGIESGDNISQTQMADFQKKIAMANVATTVADENADEVSATTEEAQTEKTEAEKAKAAEEKLMADTLKELGIEAKSEK